MNACLSELSPWIAGIGIFVSALIAGVLVTALLPTLRRVAVAEPGPRSSHLVPTPQGGGIAVIAAVVLVTSGLMAFNCALLAPASVSVWIVLASAGFLALVGITNDIEAIPVVPRMLLQAVAVAAVLAALPEDLSILPFLPVPLERFLLFAGGLWFINLVNFMDGIDWMTVAAVTPMTAGLTVLGYLGALPAVGTIVALALLGALIGFAPFNRPVARLFLGDAGSLPIALLLGWMILLLAANGYIAAAVLLPLYYVTDTTITLFIRIFRGDEILRAHRTHYYQRAAANGLSVPAIVTRVFIVQTILTALAVISALYPGWITGALTVLCGAGLVCWLLCNFTRARL